MTKVFSREVLPRNDGESRLFVGIEEYGGVAGPTLTWAKSQHEFQARVRLSCPSHMWKHLAEVLPDLLLLVDRLYHFEAPMGREACCAALTSLGYVDTGRPPITQADETYSPRP